MQDSKKWYTISQAARHLGVSPDTLRRWEKAKKISSPTRTAGGARRYSKELLDQILSGKKMETTKSSKTTLGLKQLFIGLLATIITLAILLPILFLINSGS